MPSDYMLKGMNLVHRGLLAVTFGKFGWDVAGMAALELTTIGRTSGQPRSVMLTSPLQEGDTIVVVASRGGDDHHPAWYLNLVANPDVQVVWKGKPKVAMTARTATPEERARMWPLITAKYKNYGDYQTKTDREIPLVLLTPKG